MGEMKNTKKFTGCTCGCGTGTWGTYAPGHDAKHVARLVRWVVEAWTIGYGGETEVRWERALKNLPTEALRSKFRRQMMARAIKQLGATIQPMRDAEWQRKSHLAHSVARIDSAFAASSPLTIAEAAAAMGMSQRAVNYRNS